jgi:hypothetical protein
VPALAHSFHYNFRISLTQKASHGTVWSLVPKLDLRSEQSGRKVSLPPLHSITPHLGSRLRSLIVHNDQIIALTNHVATPFPSLKSLRIEGFSTDMESTRCYKFISNAIASGLLKLEIVSHSTLLTDLCVATVETLGQGPPPSLRELSLIDLYTTETLWTGLDDYVGLFPFLARLDVPLPLEHFINLPEMRFLERAHCSRRSIDPSFSMADFVKLLKALQAKFPRLGPNITYTGIYLTFSLLMPTITIQRDAFFGVITAERPTPMHDVLEVLKGLDFGIRLHLDILTSVVGPSGRLPGGDMKELLLALHSGSHSHILPPFDTLLLSSDWLPQKTFASVILSLDTAPFDELSRVIRSFASCIRSTGLSVPATMISADLVRSIVSHPSRLPLLQLFSDSDPAPDEQLLSKETLEHFTDFYRIVGHDLFVQVVTTRVRRDFSELNISEFFLIERQLPMLACLLRLMIDSPTLPGSNQGQPQSPFWGLDNNPELVELSDFVRFLRSSGVAEDRIARYFPRVKLSAIV